MSEQYAQQYVPMLLPGTATPVDRAVHEDIRLRLQQGTKKGPRAEAERDAYIAQRFPAWQVFPVRIGRWRLKLYGLADPGNGWGDDALSMILFLLYLIYLVFWFIGWSLFGFGKWVAATNVIQVLDPATGRPIAEHVVKWRDGEIDPSARTLAFLGDPRVCGLIGQVGPQGTVTIGGSAFNRGRRWNAPAKRWTPQAIERNFAQLAAAPYREYSSYRCGPWLQDSPAPPKNGHTWWTRYKPGK